MSAAELANLLLVLLDQTDPRENPEANDAGLARVEWVDTFAEACIHPTDDGLLVHTEDGRYLTITVKERA